MTRQRSSLDETPTGLSAGRRGILLVGGFWVVILSLLGARIALFDEITAAAAAIYVTRQIAWLSVVLR